MTLAKLNAGALARAFVQPVWTLGGKSGYGGVRLPLPLALSLAPAPVPAPDFSGSRWNKQDGHQYLATAVLWLPAV